MSMNTMIVGVALSEGGGLLMHVSHEPRTAHHGKACQTCQARTANAKRMLLCAALHSELTAGTGQKLTCTETLPLAAFGLDCLHMARSSCRRALAASSDWCALTISRSLMWCTSLQAIAMLMAVSCLSPVIIQTCTQAIFHCFPILHLIGPSAEAYLGT